MENSDRHIFDDFDDLLIKDHDGQIRKFKESRIQGETADQTDEGQKMHEESESLDVQSTETNAGHQTETLEGGDAQKISEATYEEAVQRILNESGIALSDEVLQRRLTTIILTRLKDVRSAIETREILLRSPKIGGMGFSEKEADSLMHIIESHLRKIKNREGQIVEDIPFVNQEQETGRKEEFQEQTESSSAVHEKKQESHSLSLEEDSQHQKKDILKMIEELEDYDIIPKKRPSEPAEKTEAAEKQSLAGEESMEKKESPVHLLQHTEGEEQKKKSLEASERKQEIQKDQKPQERQEDEKKLVTETAMEHPVQSKREKEYHPKLIGPIAELREIDAETFRRLDEDPVQACERIRRKIEILGQESFAKKLQGIEAWRQSRIFQLYTQMVKTSLAEKIPVEEVSRQFQKENKPYLTSREIEAIADFNQSLRF